VLVLLGAVGYEPMAIRFYQLALMDWGVTQAAGSDISAPTTANLAITGSGAWATVNAQECLRQATFSVLDTDGNVAHSLRVNAYRGPLVTDLWFRLQNVTSSTTIVSGTAKWATSANPITIYAIDAANLPAADARVELQYWLTGSGAGHGSFLAACWLMERTP